MKNKIKNQNKLKQRIMFISYFAGVKGNCPAEWADDKLKVLEYKNQKTIVITGLQSEVKNSKNIIFYKIPSLSFSNFKWELKIYRENENNHFPFSLKIFYLFSLIFGSLYDFIMIRLVNSLTGSYWSWFLIAFPVAVYLKLKNNINTIFTTGGPTSAHLLGVSLAFFFNVRCICEHQDPLVGECITNPRSRKIAKFLEKFFNNYASKIIYVTKNAAESAKKRSQNNEHKIKFIYPGSWKFKNYKKQTPKNKIEFLHLGTLYGNRNLDLFFKALDKLKENLPNKINSKSLKIINSGEIYLSNKNDYLKRSDFDLISIKTRESALKRALKCSYLLLVQHNDERSKETIPYKFYDYLNLRIPIFAITKNEELNSLILKTGGIVCKADSIDSIHNELFKLITLENENRDNKMQNEFDINIIDQFQEALH